MVTSGHTARTWSTNSATASITCSQVSRYNSTDRSPRNSMTSEVFNPFGSACMPKDVATAAATSAPVGMTARSTKHTESPCSATRRAATWLAIDVFPTPPGPSSVTSRSRLQQLGGSRGRYQHARPADGSPADATRARPARLAGAHSVDPSTSGPAAGSRSPGPGPKRSGRARAPRPGRGGAGRGARGHRLVVRIGTTPAPSAPTNLPGKDCQRRSGPTRRRPLSCLPAARSASVANSIMSRRWASTWRATASAEASSRSPANGTPAKSPSAERANRPASPMFPEYAAARARSTQWLKRWRSIASRSRRRT